MLKIKDIMKTDVVSVDPDLTLREVMEVLSEAEVSGAPVVVDGRVGGVISTTDLLRFREDQPGYLPRSEAGFDESSEAPGGRGESSPTEFFVEGWGPWEADALAWMRGARESKWDLLDEHTVEEIMTRDVISRPSSTTVRQAAGYMLESGVHRLLVIDDGRLQGIVTNTDIVRAVAEGRLAG